MYRCILDRAQPDITSGPESPENFQNPDCLETEKRKSKIFFKIFSSIPEFSNTS